MSENLEAFVKRIQGLEKSLGTDFRLLMEVRHVYGKSMYDVEVVEPTTARTLVKASGYNLDEALWYAQERLNVNLLRWDQVGLVKSGVDSTRHFDVV